MVLEKTNFINMLQKKKNPCQTGAMIALSCMVGYVKIIKIKWVIKFEGKSKNAHDCGHYYLEASFKSTYAHCCIVQERQGTLGTNNWQTDLIPNRVFEILGTFEFSDRDEYICGLHAKDCVGILVTPTCLQDMWLCCGCTRKN